MLGIVIFLTVSLSNIFHINGNPLRENDIHAILDMLQRNGVKEKSLGETTSSSSSESEENHTKNLITEQLKTMDVIDLIQEANRENDKKDKRKINFRATPNSITQYYRNYYKGPDKSDKSSRLKDHILQLLQKGREISTKDDRPRLIPNRLLGQSKSRGDGEQEQVDGLQKYSKIFVVLDPAALKDSSNKDLPNLVKNILLQSSSVLDKPHQDRNMLHRYKGFAVKDHSSHRRFRRDSKEMYGGGSGGGGGMDLDDDYRPKRPRNDHGGGGGGGGRTAIPYIRHRGDIYERDH